MQENQKSNYNDRGRRNATARENNVVGQDHDIKTARILGDRGSGPERERETERETRTQRQET
jgi:hypothetical protein